MDILFIEFQFVRTYINSLAVQAVVDLVLSRRNPESRHPEFIMICVFEWHSVDSQFIQEVVDRSRKILQTVVAPNEGGLLKYCPARIFQRVISASILMLKVSQIPSISLQCYY
jgi:elongation factor P--beta-lysine ligase